MREYLVVPFLTGCFSGSLDHKKLTQALNQYAQQGWRFVRTIHESKGSFIKRESHFLVFERGQ